MFDVHLWKFDKKTNSTAQPTGDGVVLSCKVMTPSDIMNPSIELKASPLAFNYAYIPSWGRYYFIDDIQIVSGAYIVSLSVDVLGSYKTQIGAHTAYILRSASNSNGAINDTLYPATSNITRAIVDAKRPLSVYWDGWTNAYFVLGIQGYGSDTGDNAGIIYYQANYSQFIQLLTGFYANSNDQAFWGNIDKGVINSLNNITDFIVSCRAYPVSMEVANTNSKLYIGSWNSGLTLPKVIGGALFSYTFENIPKHPQAATRGVYLNTNPYTRYYFTSAMIGNFELDPFIMRDITAFTIDGLIDYTTGEALIDFNATGNLRFIETFATVGVDVPLSGVEVSLGGIAAGAVKGVASALTGDWLGAASGVGNALMNATQGQNTKTSERGGFMIWSSSYSPYVDCIFHEVIDEDQANQGRPLCELKQINTLSGYVVVNQPHISAAQLARENDMINNYMAGGFYYE